MKTQKSFSEFFEVAWGRLGVSVAISFVIFMVLFIPTAIYVIRNGVTDILDALVTIFCGVLCLGITLSLLYSQGEICRALTDMNERFLDVRDVISKEQRL